MRYAFIFLFLLSTLLFTCSEGAVKSSKTTFEQGKSFLQDGDRLLENNNAIEAKKYYKLAVAEFENAVRENPEQENLAKLLGISQYRIRDFDNCIQWLNKAISKNSKDPVSYQYLGYALMNKSKIPEAENAFRKAFALDQSGAIKKESIDELMEIGQLSLNLANNFIQQGSKAQGFEFKKLGMRIMSSALQYSGYDLDLAKKIELYAVESKDQIIIDWIRNVIAAEEDKGSKIEIKL